MAKLHHGEVSEIDCVSYPICEQVVEIENKESRRWFLTWLLENIDNIRDMG
ncbi:hypothetical protein TanjilG_14999 [Lupinus angustifolius]|uniref:Uncharacterized protein n=1 Tax=Lupinus angustifolius TaxID=3871 RepID=A0A4P1RAD7_LUPAN|nr:hypothetical protein TanjilG_14999 [Lupinus angustifolius]